MERTMDKCEHYTIRGDVAQRREKNPRLNYPFTVPEEVRQELIKSLLPYMDSRKCKQWHCKHCVREFLEQDCPHDHQLTIEVASPSVAATSIDNVLVTSTNDSTMEKINVGTNSAAVRTDISSIEVIIRTDLENAGVELTKKNQTEPKVFFDLNEAPIPETCDEPLRNNNAPATEELAVDNPDRSITELVSVDEQQTKNIEDLEASTQVPINDVGNSNVSPSRAIEVDGDLVPKGNKTLINKKARRYHTISYLIREGQRKESMNVPSPHPQPTKTELKNKNKMQQCGIQEQQIGSKISEATENASGENIENRTFDLNLPLDQNYQLAGVSLSLRRESSGKRKHQVSHDQNGNSDANVPDSSEDGLQNEVRSVLQLKKGRIFGSVVKTPLTDADQSKQVEPDGLKSKAIHEHGGSDKSDKNDPSSSKRKENLSTPAVDCGNSRPTRIKKLASKEAYRLMLQKKLKNKNRSESSGTASDKKCPEKSSPVVVGKELILQDVLISTTGKDVPMPCLENDNFKLSQLKTEIIKSRMLNRGVSLKRLKVDSPSANKKQNVNPPRENETSSPTQSKKSGGKGKDEDKLTLGAPPQQKMKEIDKSSGKELKKRGRKRKVVMSSDASGSGFKKIGGNEQFATVGKELVLKDGTALSPISPNEEPLRLLSMVAARELESAALSDIRLDRTILPIVEEFHEPPIRDVREMGYDGCIELTNPADYFLVDGEGDNFKLGPEDLPLRPHRMLPAQRALHIRSLGPADRLLPEEDQRTNAASGTPHVL